LFEKGGVDDGTTEPEMKATGHRVEESKDRKRKEGGTGGRSEVERATKMKLIADRYETDGERRVLTKPKKSKD